MVTRVAFCLAVVLAAVALAGSVVIEADCDVYQDGRCWRAFPTESKDKLAARTDCLNWGGDMAKVISEPENKFAAQLMDGAAEYWVGLYTNTQDLRWYVDDTVSVPFATCPTTALVRGDYSWTHRTFGNTSVFDFLPCGCWENGHDDGSRAFLCAGPGEHCPSPCATCSFDGGLAATCLTCKDGYGSPPACDTTPAGACPAEPTDPLAPSSGSWSCTGDALGDICTFVPASNATVYAGSMVYTCMEGRDRGAASTAAWAGHLIEVASPPSSCPLRYDGSCYNVLTGHATVASARSACTAAGGLLAAITTAEEHHAIHSHQAAVHPGTDFLFGLTDEAAYNTLAFDSGEIFNEGTGSFAPWEYDAPRQVGYTGDGEFGIAALVAASGGWSTARAGAASLAAYGFVCESAACPLANCRECSDFDTCTTCEPGWLNPPACDTPAATWCPAAPVPPNGTVVSGCDARSVGATCEVDCAGDLILAGSSVRTCLPTGQWSGTARACVNWTADACPNELGQRCYQVFVGPADRASAVSACNAWGGTLATASTGAEVSFVAGLAAGVSGGGGGVWIGANDFASDRLWVWDDGTAFDYGAMPWGDGFPTTNGNAGVVLRPSGAWRDTSSLGSALPYACSRDNCALQCSGCDGAYDNCITCATGFWNAPACDVTPPSQVTTLSVQALSPTEVRLDWLEPGDIDSLDTVVYNVFLGTAPSVLYFYERANGSTTHVAAGLQPQVTYYFHIESEGNAGSLGLPTSAPRSATTWAVCPLGTRRVDTDSCLACEVGEYAADDQSECLSCPLRTTSAPLSSGVTACLCEGNAYSATGEIGTACEPCPLGAVCPGGLARPYAKPGWFPSEDAAVFLRCDSNDACLGGLNATCGVGYEGRLCAECGPDFFRQDTRCTACGGRAGLALVLVLLFAVAFCCVVLAFNVRDRNVNRLAAFTIGFNALQMTAIYSRLDLDWSSLVLRVFSIFAFFNFDLELASPECALSVSGEVWYLKWGLTMLLPVFFIIFFGIAFGLAVLWLLCVRKMGPRCADGCCRKPLDSENSCARRCGGCFTNTQGLTPGAIAQGVKRSYWQFLYLAYLPLLSMTVKFFDCAVGEDGVRVLSAARSTLCYTPQYNRLVGVAVVCAVLYCVGIPAAIVVLLRRKRRALGAVPFALKYGFLVARFKEDKFTYEVHIMLRKLFLVLSQMALLSTDDYVRAAWGAMVLGVSLAVLVFHQPYVDPAHNVLAVLSLGMAWFALWISSGVVAVDTFRHALVVMALATLAIAILVVVGMDLFMAAKSSSNDVDDSNFATTGEVDTSHASGRRMTQVEDVELNTVQRRLTDSASQHSLDYADPTKADLIAADLIETDNAAYESDTSATRGNPVFDSVGVGSVGYSLNLGSGAGFGSFADDATVLSDAESTRLRNGSLVSRANTMLRQGGSSGELVHYSPRLAVETGSMASSVDDPGSLGAHQYI